MSLHFCLLHQTHQAAMNHVSVTVFENHSKKVNSILGKIRETLFTVRNSFHSDEIFFDVKMRETLFRFQQNSFHFDEIFSTKIQN